MIYYFDNHLIDIWHFHLFIFQYFSGRRTKKVPSIPHKSKITHKPPFSFEFPTTSNFSELKTPTANDIQQKFHKIRKCFQSLDAHNPVSVTTPDSSAPIVCAIPTSKQNHLGFRKIVNVHPRNNFESMLLGKQPCKSGSQSIRLWNNNILSSNFDNSSPSCSDESFQLNKSVDSLNIARRKQTNTVDPSHRIDVQNLSISSHELPVGFNGPFYARKSKISTIFPAQLVWNENKEKNLQDLGPSKNKETNVLHVSTNEETTDQINKSQAHDSERPFESQPSSEISHSKVNPENCSVQCSTEIASFVHTGETSNDYVDSSNLSISNGSVLPLVNEIQDSITKNYINERWRKRKLSKLMRKLFQNSTPGHSYSCILIYIFHQILFSTIIVNNLVKLFPCIMHLHNHHSCLFFINMSVLYCVVNFT